MKLPYLLSACILFQFISQAQRIMYSDPEKIDFDRLKFDVIAKHNNNILVYKATYFHSPYSQEAYPQSQHLVYGSRDPFAVIPGIAPSPNTSIAESAIYIYDLEMKLQQTIVLPLPKELTGTHFLVYEDYFYMFYQYQRVHTIYCMAVKIGFDGKLIGSPVELDHTEVMDIHYQSQIYSVIYSEDKKQLAIFNIDWHNRKSYTINALFFDDQLHLTKKFNSDVNATGTEFLSEFKIDNDGNFIFMGCSESSDKDNNKKAVVCVLKKGESQLSMHYVVPPDIFTDELRLLIDNMHKQYILCSLYSTIPTGDINGLYTVALDALTDNPVSTVMNIFDDSLRRQVKEKGDIRGVFNDFYLQDVQLRNDGGFNMEIQELQLSPYRLFYNRWNYLQYFSEQVASNFIFYDPYEFDHYYPWKEWRYLAGNGYTYSSSKTMLLSCDSNGEKSWSKIINTNQVERLHATPGLKSIVSNGLVYLLFNEKIKGKTYLTAQNVNTRGEMNTDSQMKEDVEIPGVNRDLTHFPRFAKLVSQNEIIFPCRKGRGDVYLAKIEF